MSWSSGHKTARVLARMHTHPVGASETSCGRWRRPQGGKGAGRLIKQGMSGRPVSLVGSVQPSSFRDSPALCPQTGKQHRPQGGLWPRASLAF